MGLPIHSHQVCEIDVRVHLSGAEGTVTEELLYGPQVHSGLEQVAGKCVTQSVRIDGVEVGSVLHRCGKQAAH